MKDYDRLLDDLTDKVYDAHTKLENESPNVETGSYRHGYLNGYSSGMFMVLAWLNRLENKKEYDI